MAIHEKHSPLKRKRKGAWLNNFPLRTLIVLFLFIWTNWQSVHATEHLKEVRIGVLAFRQPEQALAKWHPTADYLNHMIDGYTFKMIPMNYPQVDDSVAAGTIDFILTNTGHYVALEHQHGISRVVTLVKKFDNKPIKSFGGIIFTRADRKDINSLSDLKGKTFMAVGSNSLGGFLVAWQQLQRAGIDPHTDFKELRFHGMPHDGVVFSVLSGESDAGTVRTNVIEQMIAEGKIEKDAIKLLNSRISPGFPWAHSTELFPEWPLARLSHTEDRLAEKVVVALLSLPENDPAARQGSYARWTTPLNYNGVHELFKELRTGPYEGYGSFTIYDVIKKHLSLLISIAVLIIVLTVGIIKTGRLNRSLSTALSEVKTLRGFLPICSSCKKIRDDSGYWNRIETYIREHSEAEFSHSICPDCSARLYAKYEQEQVHDTKR